MNLKDAFAAAWNSIVRTVVPLIIGSLFAWLTSVGIEADAELETSLGIALTLLFTSIYYATVRLLETKFNDKWGLLLGSTKQPVYQAEYIPRHLKGSKKVEADEAEPVAESPNFLSDAKG